MSVTMPCPACNGTMRDTETVAGRLVVECVECLARMELGPWRFPMRRRVHDVWSDQYGWAVEHLTHNRYRVEWDSPTPHQDTAKAVIPSKFFVWADSEQLDGDGDRA